jgi:hypothetical protein
MKLRIIAAFALASASLANAQEVDPANATPISGDWSYSQISGGTQASFLTAGGAPQIDIRCLRASRQVVFSKPATGAVPFLNVWTSSLTRDLPASYEPAVRRLVARVSVTDPLLDALVYSRARIAFTVRGSPQLVLPNFPEVTRVVEDCRA